MGLRTGAATNTEPEHFSIEVHHGGNFGFKPMKVYNRGEVVTFHRLHSDYISKLEFHCMAQKLGYANSVAFYYIKPEFSLDNGLVSFKSDAPLLDMLKFLHKDKLTKVY